MHFLQRIFPAPLLCLLLLLGGCASPVAFPPDQAVPKAGPGVPPPVAGRIPVEYEPVGDSAQARPAWIDLVPDDENGLHYMVGLSEYHTSEQEARNAAMRHVRGEYARYTGVDVAEIDEVARYLSGSESEILDGTINGKMQSTQKTDARVSRIKAKQWYGQRFRMLKDGKFAGTAFKNWVLVTIPVDEEERVAQWRLRKAKAEEDRLAREQAEEKRSREEAEKSFQAVLSRHRQVMVAFEAALAAGDIVQALNRVQEEGARLAAERSRFEKGDSHLKAKAAEFDPLLLSLGGETTTIGTRIFIDTGRFGAVALDPRGGDEILPVWVWLRHRGGTIPVANLTLVLTDAAGKIRGRARTASSGRAEFFADGLPTGRYFVAVDTASGALSLLPVPIRAGIAKVERGVNLSRTEEDLEGATRLSIRRLFAGSARQPLATERIVMGPVIYAESGQGGSFALMLQRQLRRELTGIEGLTLLEPRRRSLEMVKSAVRTRGIGIKKAQKAPALGSAGMQAAMDGAQAALEANYSLGADAVLLDISLKAAGTDEVLSAASARIALDAIPPGVNLAPEGAEDFTPKSVAGSSAIRVDISSHLGDGRTYVEGDSVSYFAHTDRDAYLLLVYEDAAGNLIQIFPNKHSDNKPFAAGSAIEVPGPADSFEFVITEPFGRERVFVFASGAPFPELAGEPLGDGLKLLGGGMDTLLKRLRPAAGSFGSAYGEAFTVLTTVSRESVLSGQGRTATAQK